jgi:hypothetical protein
VSGAATESFGAIGSVAFAFAVRVTGTIRLIKGVAGCVGIGSRWALA